VWQSRSGPWLRVRVLGLLTEPKTRLFRVLRERDHEQAGEHADESSFDDY
jgi:hypothetical protein